MEVSGTDGPDVLANSHRTLDDEVLSLNSIYGTGTLSLTRVTADSLAGTEGSEAVFCLPSHPALALRIFFPADYADEPPAVLGTQSVGDGLPKGAGQTAVRAARRVLENVFQPGQPCLFDVAEELGEVLNKELDSTRAGQGSYDEHDEVSRLQDGCVAREDGQAQSLPKTSKSTGSDSPAPQVGPPPDWVTGTPITEKKSVFLARCVSVSSVAEAQHCVAHLLATDRRAARATHNISAWRIRAEPETATSHGASAPVTVTYQDFDEDGETAAGGRVLRLLQMMDVWNVVVVVSRWYGGILLGPARFAIINEAAREVVVAWQSNSGEPDGKGKAAKKVKR